MKILLGTISAFLVVYSPLSQSSIMSVSSVLQGGTENVSSLDNHYVEKRNRYIELDENEASTFFIEDFNVDFKINNIFNIFPEKVNLFDDFEYFNTCVGLPCLTSNWQQINIIAEDNSSWLAKCKRCNRLDSNRPGKSTKRDESEGSLNARKPANKAAPSVRVKGVRFKRKGTA